MADVEIVLPEEMRFNIPQHRLRVRYLNHRGETSERVIQPFGVRYGSSQWYKSDQWLMIAFDYTRDNFREFAMSYMSVIEVLPKLAT